MYNKFNIRQLIKQPSKGFTLIELLIFMTILSALLLVLSSVFASIMEVQLESESYSSVDTDGRYILTKLIYDFQSADTVDSTNNHIDLPVPGDSGDTLVMAINSDSHTYSLVNGNLQLVDPSATTNNLNSIDTIVSDLNFQRLGAGTNNDTISVSFRLTSKYQRKNGPEFRIFQTTLSMP